MYVDVIKMQWHLLDIACVYFSIYIYDDQTFQHVTNAKKNVCLAKLWIRDIRKKETKKLKKKHFLPYRERNRWISTTKPSSMAAKIPPSNTDYPWRCSANGIGNMNVCPSAFLFVSLVACEIAYWLYRSMYDSLSVRAALLSIEINSCQSFGYSIWNPWSYTTIGRAHRFQSAFQNRGMWIWQVFRRRYWIVVFRVNLKCATGGLYNGMKLNWISLWVFLLLCYLSPRPCSSQSNSPTSTSDVQLMKPGK